MLTESGLSETLGEPLGENKDMPELPTLLELDTVVSTLLLLTLLNEEEKDDDYDNSYYF